MRDDEDVAFGLCSVCRVAALQLLHVRAVVPVPDFGNEGVEAANDVLGGSSSDKHSEINEISHFRSLCSLSHNDN